MVSYEEKKIKNSEKKIAQCFKHFHSTLTYYVKNLLCREGIHTLYAPALIENGNSKKNNSNCQADFLHYNVFPSDAPSFE